MTEHSIFYYSYTSFQGEHELLLKAAALYFDKLYILDLEKANCAVNGQSPLIYDMNLPEKEKILVRIAPEDVLYNKVLTLKIQRAQKIGPNFGA
jgi:hypothetical protein